MRVKLFDVIALVFLGGIVTGLATFLGWMAAASWLWLPFWKELRARGMYTHDIGAGYLVAFGPIGVGGLFVLTTVICFAVFVYSSRSKWCSLLILIVNLVPAVFVFLFLNYNAQRGFSVDWQYPLAETIVLLVGISWGFALLAILRWLQQGYDGELGA